MTPGTELICIESYGDIPSLQAPVRDFVARLRTADRRLSYALATFAASAIGPEAFDAPAAALLEHIDRADSNATALALAEAIEGVGIGLDAAGTFAREPVAAPEPSPAIAGRREKVIARRKAKPGKPKDTAPRFPYGALAKTLVKLLEIRGGGEQMLGALVENLLDSGEYVGGVNPADVPRAVLRSRISICLRRSPRFKQSGTGRASSFSLATAPQEAPAAPSE